MDNIEQFPKRRVYPKIVSPAEMYAQPEPSDAMVWAVCPHIRGGNPNNEDFRCMQCPRLEKFDNGFEGQRMCFGLAREACQVVMAMLKREGKM